MSVKVVVCDTAPDCAVTVSEAGPGFVVDLFELPQPAAANVSARSRIKLTQPARPYFAFGDLAELAALCLVNE